MFPLKDSIPSRHFPYINTLFIIINIIVFFYELALGERLNQFMQGYGFIPRLFFAPFDVVSFKEKIIPLFTSMFLHGNFFHIISNMYFLYIFGDNVEDQFGHINYFFIYLTFGLIAALTQAILFPSAEIPTIGASGAVAGVMGAYLIMFPRAFIKTVVILIVFVTIVDIPAVIFLGLWFLIQFLNGVVQASAGSAAGVAWWAHIGGFVIGICFGIVRIKKYRVSTKCV